MLHKRGGLEVADDAVGSHREENAVMKFVGGFLDNKWLAGGATAVVLLATVFGVTIGVVAFQRHTVVEKWTSELSEEGEREEPLAQSVDNDVYAKELDRLCAEMEKERAVAEKKASKSSEEGKRRKSGLGQKVYNGSPRAELIIGSCFTNRKAVENGSNDAKDRLKKL